MIEFDTSRFGRLRVEENRIIHFPDGLVGLSHLKRYVLLDYKDTEIKWLQSVDDPSVAFIVVAPFVLDRNYEITLPAQVTEALEIKDEGEVAILVILRVDGERLLANFQGPLVINTSKMKGYQLIVESASVVAYNNLNESLVEK